MNYQLRKSLKYYHQSVFNTFLYRFWVIVRIKPKLLFYNDFANYIIIKAEELFRLKLT